MSVVENAAVVALLLLSPAGCRTAVTSCVDGEQNGGETDVDCGGDQCAACADGQACQVDFDCLSARCPAGTCLPVPACQDGRRDADETDVDCGGPTCAACADGRRCTAASDCRSGFCIGGVCLASGTCDDGLKDDNEVDVDCGGRCPPCPTGAACTGDGDCATSICTAGTCRGFPCSDGLLDGDESDVDCGGLCAPCGSGQACHGDNDCESGVCSGGLCGQQTMTCPIGYRQDPQTELCVCDPLTCDSCCNVSEDNGCGYIALPGHNNCGSKGQQCFRCSGTQSCAESGTGDYCADPCVDGVECKGCCGIGRALQMYCFRGERDYDCGSGGGRCVDCAQQGQLCVAQACQ